MGTCQTQTQSLSDAELEQDDAVEKNLVDDIEEPVTVESCLTKLEIYVNNACKDVPKKIYFPDPYTEYSEEIKDRYEVCMNSIKKQLDHSLNNGEAIHPYYVFALSRHLEIDHDEEQSEWENKLYEYGSNILLKGDAMTSNEKHLAKMCLSWVPKVLFNYETLIKWKGIADITLEKLSKPLETEYDRISESNNSDGNKLVHLTLNDDYKYEYKSNIISQHWVIPENEWRQAENGFMMSCQEIIECQKQLKILHLNDCEIFKKCCYDDFKYEDIHECEIMYDDFYREYVRAIGCQVNDAFQSVMNELFIMNRNNMNMNMNENEMDKDLGHSEAAVKSISRVLNKEGDYEQYGNPPSQYILDWVRCGIVIENVTELLSLYELILERFKGNMIRIKNGFGKDVNTSYGYRAVLINLIYEHDIGLQNLQMICEVQLILLPYLKVRKKMHLYYKIARVECDETSFNADIGMELAGDFSKFADMDIVN